MSDRLKFILYLARQEANKRADSILLSEDLLAAMASEKSSASGRILATYEVEENDVKQHLDKQKKSLISKIKAIRGLDEILGAWNLRTREENWSEQFHADLHMAELKAQELGHKEITDLHLLWSMASNNKDIQSLLDDFGVNLKHILPFLEYEVKRARTEEQLETPAEQEALRKRNTVADHLEATRQDSGPEEETIDRAELRVDARAMRILRHAIDQARSRNHKIVTAWHLVESIAEEASRSTPEFYVENNDRLDRMRIKLADQLVKSTEEDATGKTSLSENLRSILSESARIAELRSAGIVDLHHLALALIKEAEPDLTGFLDSFRLGRDLIDDLISCINWWNNHRITRDWAAFSGSVEQIEKLLVSGDNDDDYGTFLSCRSENLIDSSFEEASREHQSQACIEQLFLAILYESESIAADILIDSGVYLDTARTSLRGAKARGIRRKNGYCSLSFKSRRLLKVALKEARAMLACEIEPEHILIAMLRERDGLAYNCFAALDLDAEFIEKELEERMRTRSAS
ncbi:MAG: Clp protease N-terminal domain-containing protein [Candidatus Obscuribacterales bacterium]